MKKHVPVAALVALAFTASTFGQIRITEWMYNGLGTSSIGEFVELTNVGGLAIDMTGWSFDDNSRQPGSQSLSAFGVVIPGQSVILTDMTVAAFNADWNLSGIVVIGGNTNNLGRGDEINIYDNASTLVDRLTYDDQNLGGPRTNGTSANPNSFAVLGTNDCTQWTLSSVGDAFGSYHSAANETGNPGHYPVPEPSALAMAFFGGLLLLRRR